MSVLGTGTEIAVIVAAMPAATGAVVWTLRQRDRLRERRTARETRNWSGYVITPGIATWYVKVIKDPDTKWTERVVLDVVNPDGTPSPEMAHALRLYADGDGTLGRSPTPAQWEFLKDLQKDRFNRGDGYPIQ
jgi:hypothetical protein